MKGGDDPPEVRGELDRRVWHLRGWLTHGVRGRTKAAQKAALAGVSNDSRFVAVEAM